MNAFNPVHRFYVGCALGFSAFAIAVFLIGRAPAKAESAWPQVKSIEVTLTRDRRRFPKFLKIKQRKEQGNAGRSETFR